MDEAKFKDGIIPPIDPVRTYSLAELIDLAETQNPTTRVAWEQARAQAAALGIARSELYPALGAIALSGINRGNTFSDTSFHIQTMWESEGGLDLNYTIFDFGARAGRISAAKAEVLAANFLFNDAHRQLIFQVEQAYFQLLNSSGQLDAAKASLTNALEAQHAAEDRLQQGLATLPDTLEARSAAANAEYELQAATGAEEIARGKLAQALGTSPTLLIQVQPLDRLAIPESISDTVDDALNRAFKHRPDLMRELAEVRSTNAKVKEARAAYYPTLNFEAWGGGQSFYAMQQSYPWEHAANWAGEAGLNLTWSLFDGGLRKNKLAQAKADVLASEAKVSDTRNAVAQEVWTAYSNLRTAIQQRQSASALLAAAEESYSAVLDSYNHGVRNFLDVTSAQQTLAQARSTDVYARTEVLLTLAQLAYQTGDSIQPNTREVTP